MKTALSIMAAAAIAGFATVAVAEDVTSMTAPQYQYFPTIGKFVNNPKPYSKHYYHPKPDPDKCSFTKKPFFDDVSGSKVKFKEKKIRFKDYDYNRYDYLTRIVATCKIPLDYRFFFKKKFTIKGFECKYEDNNYWDMESRDLTTWDSKLVIKKGAKFADLKCVFYDKPDYDEPDYDAPDVPVAETPVDDSTGEEPVVADPAAPL